MPVSAPVPFHDVMLLARWIGGLLLIVVGPGHLLIGRHLVPLDRLSRFGLSWAAGLCWTALASQLCSVLGIPIAWWTNVALAVALAAALHRFAPGYAPAVAGLAAQIRPLGAGYTVGLLVIAAALAALLAQELGAYAVPPGLHDSSNHAYLALRILEARSTLPGEMFTGLHAPPPIPYLVGIHAAAALISDVCGVAPYISFWYLSALAALLYPLMFSVLWRLLGFEAPAVGIGCLLLAFNYHLPISAYSWGGHGAIIGMAVLPFVVLVLVALAARPGLVVATIAGLACVGMIHLHATELFVALLLVWLGFQRAAGRRWQLRFRSRPAIAALALVAALGVLPLLGFAVKYQSLIKTMVPAPIPDLAGIWREASWLVSGGVPFLKYLALVGLAGGLLRRATLRTGLFALGVLLVYVLLVRFQDPVTRSLTRPFYSQAARVLFLVPMVLPALTGAILVSLGRLVIPGRWPWVRTAALGALVAAIIWWGCVPGSAICRRAFRDLRPKAPFIAADWPLARQIAAVVPEDALVANLASDGSFWLLHVAGLRLLDPTGWPLAAPGDVPWRDIIPYLGSAAELPQVRLLRSAGVAYLYVGASHDGQIRQGWTAAELTPNPRLELVLTNGRGTLYRVQWDKMLPDS